MKNLICQSTSTFKHSPGWFNERAENHLFRPRHFPLANPNQKRPSLRSIENITATG